MAHNDNTSKSHFVLLSVYESSPVERLEREVVSP